MHNPLTKNSVNISPYNLKHAHHERMSKDKCIHRCICFNFVFREVNKLSGKSTGKRAQACYQKLWLTNRAT